MLKVSYCDQSMSVVRRPSCVIRRAASTMSQLTRNIVGSIGVTVDQKQLNLFRSEIQDGRHGHHLENLFFASSPISKGQLT